jgi:hypothetical protein
LYPAWKGARCVVNSANAPDVYPVWYGTNRRAFSGPLAVEVIEKLSIGICNVAIPKAHKFGSIGSSSFVRYFQRFRSGGADDKLYIVQNSVMWSVREFVDSINGAMGKNRDVLVYTPPVTVVSGIDTIEVSNVNLDFLGHGYYAEAAGVLYDMAILLLNNLDPIGRPRIAPMLNQEGAAYWTLRFARD